MPEPTVCRARRGAATSCTVEAVHDALDGLWAEAGFVAETDRMAFTLAVVEAATNVLDHAVAADGQELEMAVEITVTPRRLVAQICEVNAAPAQVDLAGAAVVDGLAESGRGLAIIQALVHTVAFERQENTNVWTLCRDVTPEQP